MCVSLFARRQQHIRLDEALHAGMPFFGSGAVAICYAPEACWLATVNPDDGTLSWPKTCEAQALDNVYEARVFTSDVELRWLGSVDGTGQAVILSETDPGEEYGKPLDTLLEVTTIEQKYLLWGRGDGNTPVAGWSALSVARVGVLPIPINELPNMHRVELLVKEYLCPVDDFGNMAVVEERLLGLKEASDD